MPPTLPLDQLALAGVQARAELEPSSRTPSRDRAARSGSRAPGRRTRRRSRRRRCRPRGRGSARAARRTSAWWRSSSSRQPRSPSSAAFGGADDVGEEDRRQHAVGLGAPGRRRRCRSTKPRSRSSDAIRSRRGTACAAAGQLDEARARDLLGGPAASSIGRRSSRRGGGRASGTRIVGSTWRTSICVFIWSSATHRPRARAQRWRQACHSTSSSAGLQALARSELAPSSSVPQLRDRRRHRVGTRRAAAPAESRAPTRSAASTRKGPAPASAPGTSPRKGCSSARLRRRRRAPRAPSRPRPSPRGRRPSASRGRRSPRHGPTAPVPRLSKRIRRQKEASRSKNARARGILPDQLDVRDRSPGRRRGRTVRRRRPGRRC